LAARSFIFLSLFDLLESSIIPRMRKRTPKIIISLAILIVLAVTLYFITPIHAKLAWRVNNLRDRIIYFLHPPQEVTFHPGGQSFPTLTPDISVPTATLTVTPTIIPTELATPTPTVTATPPPASVILTNITFVDQMNRYNYCGPSNLAMALEYWGWKGQSGTALAPRDQIGRAIKPGVDDPNLNFVDRGKTDVNVMPYELVDFVNEQTTYKAIFRYGGDINLLKRLIAAGFPVITEKGIYEPLLPDESIQWGGHYSFTTGYDDSQQQFIWQDSYLPKPNSVGMNSRTSYADYLSYWRSFNYLFIIVYPADREQDLFQVLGSWGDQYWAAQHALDIANQEVGLQLSGNDLFFAMFNRVTSLVNLQNPDYGPAAAAFDEANSFYNNTLVPTGDKRIPWRILWYETGPYYAYYFSGRYQDVIDLANKNLERIQRLGESLEESLFWRARAEYALGESESAYADMRQALHFHPGFQPASYMLGLWGVTP
jgi:tetratricopeptide (TPR) repeat protein